jgi:hypothetical protein
LAGLIRRRLPFLRDRWARSSSNLTEVADHFANADQDARFELLPDLFVEGLARRAEAG